MLATTQTAVIATARAKHNFINNQRVATAAATINRRQQKTIATGGEKTVLSYRRQ